MSGILTKNSKLSYSTSGTTYTQLADLQSISKIGSDIETIEVSTLADANKKYIKGLGDYGSLECTFLYSKTLFNTLNGLTGSVNWKIELPDTLAVTFSGECSVTINEIGVNEAMKLTLNIAINSAMTFA